MTAMQLIQSAKAPNHRRRQPVPAGRVGHGKSFWLIAFAYMVTLAFTAVPVPLWSIYQKRGGFSTFMITVVFGAYAIGVIISLFLAGHVSDWLGRRRVLLAGVLIEVVAAVLFLSSTALPALITTRVISGFGIGIITATATAYLIELHRTARPGSPRTRADIVATAANIGGLAIGPLAGGLLAEHVTSPLRTPYLVFLGLLMLGAIGVMLSPETVTPPEIRTAYRPQRASVPAAARSTYYAASAATFAAFAAFGLFTSLGPGFVSGTLHHPSRTLAGLAASLVFVAATVAQTSLPRVARHKLLASGLVLMPIGLVAVTTAVWQPSLALFLGGGIVTGAGAGLLFKGSITTVLGLAHPSARSGTLAGLFLSAFAGLALPVLGVGIATQFTPDRNALIGFTALLISLCLAGSKRLVAGGRDVLVPVAVKAQDHHTSDR